MWFNKKSIKKIVFYKQSTKMDCGVCCLRMITRHYGLNFTLKRIQQVSRIERYGITLGGIRYAAEKMKLSPTIVKIDLTQVLKLEMPCILPWRKDDYVVLYQVPSKLRTKGKVYHVADPSRGLIKYTEEEFINLWLKMKNANSPVEEALILSPGSDFYLQKEDPIHKLNWSYLSDYLLKNRRLIGQLFIGLTVGSLLQLIVPFLTQAIVDVGINTQNIGFIYIIVIAQIMLLIGRLSVDLIRSWVLLHISTRLNISILTDFLIKMLKLPMSFFETRMAGDIMQRMSDQGRIQSFLTGTSLNTIFSFFNLVLFAGVLAYYNLNVFFIFFVSSVLYSIWVVIFLEKRRELDFKRFDISSRNQTGVLQLIMGMQEIKLNNCEHQKRWEWERGQSRLFKFSISNLRLGQYQQFGAFFINEGKNIIITFIVASAVIEGKLTLGSMMAIQYILGQLNSPIEQFVGFMQQLQDVKISLERLNEIYEMEDEEPIGNRFLYELPLNKSIMLDRITFSYPGAWDDLVLKNISFSIPEGKTTAIVGMSGSGKTTILKLLLRFYLPQEGKISVGDHNLNEISFHYWRSKCGIVMQDGFIFSDSIAKNIAVSDEYPDIPKLLHAIKVANINEFIEELPLGLNTIIGATGKGISQGQRQRILIARAVYKDPQYIFFDEATNSLDVNNERIIMENLETFLKGRTVVVVAHRLSTVRNADHIIVMDKGLIAEQGTHHELINNRQDYYQLVKNQLSLDR
ncbi:ABC transporter ATP-binding protein [Pedobacter sp. KBW06]|nr:ABC transporter ATP-binding protein [Pedobacter sp. KBW06]